MFDQYHDPLKELFHHQPEALQNASVLHGGQPALCWVQALIDDLEIQLPMTRGTERNLAQLHEALTLENVHDPKRIEAA